MESLGYSLLGINPTQREAERKTPAVADVADVRGSQIRSSAAMIGMEVFSATKNKAGNISSSF